MIEKRQELIDQVVKQRDYNLKLLRKHSLNNLWLFNKFVLGVEEGADRVPLAPFHKELCNFITDDKNKKKLILVPRMHLKSTLVTIGYTLQQIATNPNIRILIVSATYQNAVDFVSAIKDHLVKNAMFTELFGNMAANPIIWASDRFTLSTARTSMGQKEPTVQGVGIESNVVSKHFDIIIFDDIVVRENTETLEQRLKVIKRYRDAVDLLETNGQMIMIGTRWTYDDVYSWVLDPENQQIHQFKTFIRPAMTWEGPVEEALKTGQGFISSLWAEKFTREELYKRFQAKGPYEFSTQYLLDPVPIEDATFKTDWFHYYEETDVRGFDVNNYVLIDPAFSTAKEADFTAMVTVGIDSWGNVYVRDIVRGKFTEAESINHIFRLAEMWHPKQIGIEDLVYGKTLGYSLREEMREKGRYLPLVPVKPGGRSKEDRIRGLQPLYANGKVFHRKELSNTAWLEEELKTFPFGKHDDTIDAFSYVLEFLVRPRTRRQSYDDKFLY